MIFNNYDDFQFIVEKLRMRTGKSISFATFKLISPRQYGPYCLLKGNMIFEKFKGPNKYHVHYFDFNIIDGTMQVLGCILLHRKDLIFNGDRVS